MKNAINYYYHLYPINIYQNDKMYRFMIDNEDYSLLIYDRDIKRLNQCYEINNMLKQYNIYCHQIIKNINNEIGTNINNKIYVLLKLAKFNDYKITLDSLMYYPSLTSHLHLESMSHPNKWRDFWMERVDYFEYQVNNFKRKYPLISRTSSYYIGLAENGIQLLQNVSSFDYCVSHFRIKYDDTVFDLYNPLELVIDSRFRDVTEYLKSKFFYESLTFDDLKYYIDTNILNSDQAIIFYSRLLYPSYYFDLCDKIIYQNIDENVLSKILIKNNDYEKFLKYTIKYIKNRFQIPEIEWLIKN